MVKCTSKLCITGLFCNIRVESTDIENICTFFTKSFITLFAIMLIKSMYQIWCAPMPFFLYEFPRMYHNCSEAQLYPESFHYEMNQWFRYVHAKSNLASLEEQWHQSYSEVLQAYFYSPAQSLARTTGSTKASRCDYDLLSLSIFSLAFFQLLNLLLNLLFVFDKSLQVKQYKFPWLSQ